MIYLLHKGYPCASDQVCGESCPYCIAVSVGLSMYDVACTYVRMLSLAFVPLRCYALCFFPFYLFVHDTDTWFRESARQVTERVTPSVWMTLNVEAHAQRAP